MADPIKSLPNEIWKPVVGWEGSYEVSNMGRVKSLERIVTFKSRHGTPGTRIFGAKLKSPCIGSHGYPTVALWTHSKNHVATIHSLVLEAFVGPKPEGMECRHFPDGTRTNCKLQNLSWATHETNMRDKAAHGTSYRGESQRCSKLREPQVLEIRKLGRTGNFTQQEMADRFGVSRENVGKILRGELWAHVV